MTKTHSRSSSLTTSWSLHLGRAEVNNNNNVTEPMRRLRQQRVTNVCYFTSEHEPEFNLELLDDVYQASGHRWGTLTVANALDGRSHVDLMIVLGCVGIFFFPASKSSIYYLKR